MSTKDEALKSIAKDVLNIDQLETRNSDSLDFHSLAVWSIKEALEKAYELGCHAGSAE